MSYFAASDDEPDTKLVTGTESSEEKKSTSIRIRAKRKHHYEDIEVTPEKDRVKVAAISEAQEKNNAILQSIAEKNKNVSLTKRLIDTLVGIAPFPFPLPVTPPHEDSDTYRFVPRQPQLQDTGRLRDTSVRTLPVQEMQVDIESDMYTRQYLVSVIIRESNRAIRVNDRTILPSEPYTEYRASVRVSMENIIDISGSLQRSHGMVDRNIVMVELARAIANMVIDAIRREFPGKAVDVSQLTTRLAMALDNVIVTRNGQRI